ncbi:MAG TPA: tail fiber protein [Candidatus Cybelea sp.]|jgi:microcystin-dependent protein
MKRQAFVLSGASAALAGCASSTLVPASVGGAALTAAPDKASAETDDQLLGSIMLAPYDYVPVHFEKCAGQILPIKVNVILFSLLGVRFGGDGQTTYGLPDLRGHEPLKGLSYLIATRGIYPRRKDFERPNRAINPLIGQLSLVAYLPKYLPPRGWEKCAGQLLKINGNVALYSLLGTKFGGDGITTFGLPDLREKELLTGITYVIATNGRFPLSQN